MNYRQQSATSKTDMGRGATFVLLASLPLFLVFGSCASLNPVSGRSQAQTVAVIKQLGGDVRYDYEKMYPDVPNVFDSDATPRAPTWLRSLIGDDYFGRVVMVDLANTSTTDEDLERVRNLPHLENLNLANTNITGSGLVHLEGLKNLRYLSLWNTPVDDAELESIKVLTKMYTLVLDGANVTDAGLAHLEGLTNLEEWLGLSNTQITDAGLHHLEGLTKLQSLNLRLTRVTDAGVAQLKRALPNTDISHGP